MKLKQAKCLKQYINNLSTIKICVYSVDNFVYLYIIKLMTDLHFWGECKKTLERDLPVEEYSTWIAPLTLEQNNGSNPCLTAFWPLISLYLTGLKTIMDHY